MKRFVLFFCALTTSVCAICSEHILSLTSELCGSKSAYLSLPRVDLEEITPFTHTIAYNCGDTILGLVTPPVGDQGLYQESCAGWAFGYGCASIQAYDKYQDWTWARRSPAYLYNQAHVGTVCGVGDIDSVLNMLFHQGVCSYYLMPYINDNCSVQPDSIQRVDAYLNRSARMRLTDTTDVNEYKQILQLGHPIGVNTKYATDLQTLCSTPSAQGRWISISNNDTTKSHAMCIVGYDDHQHLFKVMNSWGTNSGDNGFVWISYNLVQNGIFNQAYVFESYGNGFVPRIEGIETLTDTTAWYHVRNIPQGETITWSINNLPQVHDLFEFVLASPQSRDSMRVAFRQKSITPGPGFEHSIGDEIDGFSIYKKADLTVTVSSSTSSYSTTKRIKKATSDPFPFSMRSNMENGKVNVTINNDRLQYAGYEGLTLELWHTIYGLMRVQAVNNATERININDLPQGVYAIILKENDKIVATDKVMVK